MRAEQLQVRLLGLSAALVTTVASVSLLAVTTGRSLLLVVAAALMALAVPMRWLPGRRRRARHRVTRPRAPGGGGRRPSTGTTR